MLREDYLISIKGKQISNGEEEKTEFKTKGDYIIKGDKKFIIYNEYVHPMLNKPITSVLKIEKDKQVTLFHNGKSRTNLILERGQRHACCYDTMAGPLKVGIFTKTIDSTLDTDGGDIKIEYSLDYNCDVNIENYLSLNVKKFNHKEEKTNV